MSSKQKKSTTIPIIEKPNIERRKYRFYIAWLAGSNNAGGEDTGINSVEDLIPEYYKKNEHVTTWDIEAENEGQANVIGYHNAFFDNWTAIDSVTDLEDITYEDEFVTIGKRRLAL